MFDVIFTIVTPFNDPVTHRWARNVDGIRAIGAVADCMAMHATPDTEVPESIRPSFVSVTVVPATA